MRDLEPAFHATGDDWIRFSVTSWIIWTAKPSMEIFARIRPHLDAADQMLVTKIDLFDSVGNLTPWIWTWINSKAPGTISSGTPAQNVLQQLGLLPPPKQGS